MLLSPSFKSPYTAARLPWCKPSIDMVKRISSVEGRTILTRIPESKCNRFRPKNETVPVTWPVTRVSYCRAHMLDRCERIAGPSTLEHDFKLLFVPECDTRVISPKA